tara:strand:- start:774 stop:1739 length:966 start_codon:yes stop_codon:yes gene_type:complete
MILTNLKLTELTGDFLKKNKFISHKIENNFIQYKKLYFNTSFFENLSFKIVTEDNAVYCPLTLEKKDGTTEINFFGDPVEIFSKKKLDRKLSDYLIKHFSNLKQKYNISNLFFILRGESEEKNNDKNTQKINKIFSDVYINLNLDKSKILANFTATLRNELKKEYDFTEYLIINKENYNKNEIFKMQEMHLAVSEKETRSKDTWSQNENMILDDNAFLIKVIHKNKTISYSFFYINQTICTYFSSCTLREYFKTVRNISHKSLWHAINYAKNKSDNFFIGSLTKYSKEKISTKELEIEKFKKKFNKNTEISCLYEDIPNSF